MLPLTIHLIVKNNESTIQDTLDSLTLLDAHILVGDLGCVDSTIEKCLSYGAKVEQLSLNDDLSQVRNHLLKKSKTKWNLTIEPWETMLAGGEEISIAVGQSPNAYKISIISGDLITKSIRMWHSDMGLKYINPVFEYVPGKAKDLPVYVASGQGNKGLMETLLEKWKVKCPLSNEPTYYTACNHLSKKEWDQFLNCSDIYLHQEKSQTMSVFMTRYYSAMVNCYIKKNYQKAVQTLMPCLIYHPTMAEFWCLLGDVYYAIKDYDRAIEFYENALIIGSRRLKTDDWPMEISKYDEYPKKMIEACKKIKQSSRLYAAK